jgi:glutamate decarboxylase
VQGASRDVAKYLSDAIGRMDAFELVSDGSDIPVFAWKLRENHTGHWTLYDLSDRLRMRGWLVPAYPMPADLASITVQRIVVRNGLSRDLAGSLLDDIETEVRYLEALEAALPTATRSHPYHH